jgi:hypothetical protein
LKRATLLATAGLAPLIAALAFVLLLGCAARARATSATAQAQNLLADANYTVTLPAVMQGVNADYVSPFGIVMYGNVDNADGLQTMQTAGTTWVTTELYWSDIQPTQNGGLDWSSFDTKADNAQAAGMNLYVLFTGNPSWAAQYPGGPVYVTQTQALVNFVQAMVERYNCDGIDDAPGHPCVHYWSFYAEPDNGDPGRAAQGKGLWGNNGAGYAAMLKQISPVIHAADPEAKVLIGGLAYDSFEPAGPFVRSFLTDTLAALETYPGGPTAYIDAVAFHYYPLDFPTITAKAEDIRGIMDRNGAGSLPLLSPETGFWSSSKWGSSLSEQADWVVENYVRGLSMNFTMLSLYKVFDDVVAGSAQDADPGDTCGLLDVNGNPKPAYYAYKTMTGELGGATYLGPFQASGVEGYVFLNAAGVQETVLWSTSSPQAVAFPYSQVRVVSATGQVSYVSAGQRRAGAHGDVDGRKNGQISLIVNVNQPIYVEPN